MANYYTLVNGPGGRWVVHFNERVIGVGFDMKAALKLVDQHDATGELVREVLR